MPKSFCIADNNVQHFALSLFDSQNNKLCDISGRHASMQDVSNFNIQDILITNSEINSGDISQKFSIISDYADISLKKNEVSGKGFIAISNPIFSATGNNWIFQSEIKKFTIKNVQVFF